MPEFNFPFHIHLILVEMIQILDIFPSQILSSEDEGGVRLLLSQPNSPRRSPKSASASSCPGMRLHSEGSMKNGSPDSSVSSQRRRRFWRIHRQRFWTRAAGFSSRPPVNDASAAAP